MPSTSVPELQQKLFKRMGVGAPEQGQGRKPRDRKALSQPLSRKDQRKTQRVQKKTHRYSRQPTNTSRLAPIRDRPNGKAGPPPNSRPKASPRAHDRSNRLMDDEDDEDEDDDEDGDEDGDEDEAEDDEPRGGPSKEEVSLEGEGEGDDGGKATNGGMPRAAKERLDQDDAEIAAFEQKLGIKKGRKSLPQSFKDDGLDDLLGDLGPEADESDQGESSKRKRDYDDWLASKRRKTGSQSQQADLSDEDESLNGLDEDSPEDDIDGLEESDDEDVFEGLDSDTGSESTTRPRQRENPYVAPTTGAVVAKYVPPSLRKVSGSEDEAHSRLRKQVQGVINRLTDANILSLVRSVEELYQNNARGHVTDILTEALLAQISKPESLPDQFFVLTGGFAAAVYKVIGSSFGSHLVNRVARAFGDEYERAVQETNGEQQVIRKEASNLLTFVSQLYVFEVVSCKIIFDYMERLLDDLTEVNVELLLRICRMAGRLLRRDDPQALKHVSSTLSKSVSKVGYANISARTKFMVETINDLRNSKPKARGLDSAVVSEHVLRMKKRLGELKSQSRRLDGLAPMGISLEDIEGADTRGKWWLVGASVPARSEGSGTRDTRDAAIDAGSVAHVDNEDMDIVLPDYPKKARAQGFSITAQVSIFTALMSARNYEHGYRQFVNLKLKKDDQLEIARVLVQCVGSEAQYNEYYALVARQACSNGRIRFALQNRLWKIFRCLGESLFGEEPEDEETAEGERMKDERRMSHVARFYASLIADGVLGIAILKPLDLPEVTSWASMLVEWLMIQLLRECRSKGADEDAKVEKVFGPARDLPALTAGVHWFLRKRVRKTKKLGTKEAKRLERVREKAQAAAQAAAVADE